MISGPELPLSASRIGTTMKKDGNKNEGANIPTHTRRRRSSCPVRRADLLPVMHGRRLGHARQRHGGSGVVTCAHPSRAEVRAGDHGHAAVPGYHYESRAVHG